MWSRFFSCQRCIYFLNWTIPAPPPVLLCPQVCCLYSTWLFSWLWSYFGKCKLCLQLSDLISVLCTLLDVWSFHSVFKLLPREKDVMVYEKYKFIHWVLPFSFWSTWVTNLFGIHMHVCARERGGCTCIFGRYFLSWGSPFLALGLGGGPIPCMEWCLCFSLGIAHVFVNKCDYRPISSGMNVLRLWVRCLFHLDER